MTTKEIVELNIAHQRGSLAQRCRVLSTDMIKLAEKLNSETDHNNLCVNSLGEIQSQGTIIDAECGRLMATISVWNMMKENE